MNAASFCKGQPTITNFGGWDGTYWTKGQPQPTLSSITIVSGSAPLATTATVTASGVVVRHSATTIVATGTITRAVGERIPANLLVISTPNAQVTARGSYYARGRTNFNAATASVSARGSSIRSGTVSMTGTAATLLTGRTTVVTTTSMTGTATLDATAHWIARGQVSLTAQGLLTGTTGHRITGASVLMQGVATFFATPPAATGVRITHQTRALLQTSFTKTQTTAALLSVQRPQTHTTAALLKATPTRTTSTDALLRGTYSRTQTTSALIWKQQSLVHSTAASIIPGPGERHHTNAQLCGLVSLSHGTNARLLIEFAGSGVLELPSLRLTGAGVINHYYPSKSELVLPKFQVQGKGTFTRPGIVPENPTDVFYRNRRYLESSYGWGRRNLFEVFNWNPCQCVTAPEAEKGPFHVEPPRPKLHHESGRILVMAEAPAPVAPPMPVFVPPQEVVRVDKPVAVLEPPPSLPESRGRGFSVGPRTRKRKH